MFDPDRQVFSWTPQPGDAATYRGVVFRESITITVLPVAGEGEGEGEIPPGGEDEGEVIAGEGEGKGGPGGKINISYEGKAAIASQVSALGRIWPILLP